MLIAVHVRASTGSCCQPAVLTTYTGLSGVEGMAALDAAAAATATAELLVCLRACTGVKAINLGRKASRRAERQSKASTVPVDWTCMPIPSHSHAILPAAQRRGRAEGRTSVSCVHTCRSGTATRARRGHGRLLGSPRT